MRDDTFSSEMLSAADWDELSANPERLVDDVRPGVRRLAIARCGDALAAGDESVRLVLERVLLGSENAADRTASAEALGRSDRRSVAPLLEAGADSTVAVVEAAVTALGEIADVSAVPWLLTVAQTHRETIVRESAVAALGAIGDPQAIEVLLELVGNGPPQVRRRCVVALTVFDDERIEPALRTAAHDRNPMVREVAEMVVGHHTEWQRLEVGDNADEKSD